MLILNWSATANSVAGCPYTMLAWRKVVLLTAARPPPAPGNFLLHPALDHATIRFAEQTVPAKQLCWQQFR
jgi:hypothetical protein